MTYSGMGLYNHLDSADEFRNVMQLPMGLAHNSPEYAPTEVIHKNIREEFNELDKELHAIRLAKPAERLALREQLLKELADAVYVCFQLASEAGWDLNEALQRIHEANLTKLDDNGDPVLSPAGKILKGLNYEPADLSDLVHLTATT